MATGDVFLSVSAQPPEMAKPPPRRSAMSPLLEEDDEVETNITGDELSHPEFEIDDEEKPVFMTETQQQNTNQNDDTSGYDMVDGVVEHDMCDRLNSDGEHFDDVFSDCSCSDGETNEGDYETDLEFDEESKYIYSYTYFISTAR